MIRGERSARGEAAAEEADSEGILEVEYFADAGRDTPRLELESDATCSGEENERRAPIPEGDVTDLSLAFRFILRKLEGSSLGRVEDEDWGSVSSDTGDATMEGDVGDLPSIELEVNLVCLASRPFPLSCALVEEVGVWVSGVAMSPTPIVFSHKLPTRRFPTVVGGHL